jgi:predicted DNA-binding transcriptional regulator YafY
MPVMAAASSPVAASAAGARGKRGAASTDPGAANRRLKEILSGSAFIRIGQIHARLSNEERCTAETLAVDLGVSVRTIKRDLDTMRDALGLPLEWDAGEHSYVYTGPCTTLPLLRMNPREALALAMVGRIGQRWTGSALGRMLGAMFDKVAPIFGDAV